MLLGSGTSSAAQVPTGWGVVLDLIRKVAALKGEKTSATLHRTRRAGGRARDTVTCDMTPCFRLWPVCGRTPGSA